MWCCCQVFALPVVEQTAERWLNAMQLISQLRETNSNFPPLAHHKPTKARTRLMVTFNQVPAPHLAAWRWKHRTAFQESSEVFRCLHTPSTFNANSSFFVVRVFSCALSSLVCSHPLSSCRRDNVLRLLGALPCTAATVSVRARLATLQHGQHVAVLRGRLAVLRFLVSITLLTSTVPSFVFCHFRAYPPHNPYQLGADVVNCFATDPMFVCHYVGRSKTKVCWLRLDGGEADPLEGEHYILSDHRFITRRSALRRCWRRCWFCA